MSPAPAMLQWAPMPAWGLAIDVIAAIASSRLSATAARRGALPALGRNRPDCESAERRLLRHLSAPAAWWPGRVRPGQRRYDAPGNALRSCQMRSMSFSRRPLVGTKASPRPPPMSLNRDTCAARRWARGARRYMTSAPQMRQRRFRRRPWRPELVPRTTGRQTSCGQHGRSTPSRGNDCPVLVERRRHGSDRAGATLPGPCGSPRSWSVGNRPRPHRHHWDLP